jgi:hypothetical protein
MNYRELQDRKSGQQITYDFPPENLTVKKLPLFFGIGAGRAT